MPMYWYNASTWRPQTDLWVWNGSVWKEVQECYIWNGSTWKLCHQALGTINSATGYDSSGVCDPTLGVFKITWTYSGNATDAYVDYAFGSPSGWTAYGGGVSVPAGDLEYSGSVEGFPGFTSLDNTYFRLRLEYNGTPINNSPWTVSGPPWTCL
jgi:hypothetical protein